MFTIELREDDYIMMSPKVLHHYLMSEQQEQKWDDILKKVPPAKLIIDGLEVYQFNYAMDIKSAIVEGNIIITQQPYATHIPYHTHNYLELIYVYQGQCTVLSDKEPILMDQGSIILINKDFPHRVLDTTKNDIILNIILKKDYLASNFLSRLSNKSIITNFLIESLIHERNSNKFLLFNTAHSHAVSDILEHILGEYFDKTLCSNEIIDSYLIILFSELIRLDENNKKINTQTTKNDVTVIDLLRYIEENYKECTLSQIGQHFNFHPNYVTKLLKQSTGKTFMDLLQLQKMNKAIMYLTDSNLSIPEIVEEIGYSSVTFFYKKFKETYSVTPHQYKKDKNKLS